MAGGAAPVTAWLLPLAIALLPVLCFLGALVWLDSYKLVRPRLVAATIAAGAVAAGLSYWVNLALLDATGLGLSTYARYLAPPVEEALKGLVLIRLIHAGRVGFLVDAAILGFAVGAGFALVENVYYMTQIADTGVGLWIVRGFGTAIMHGGASAIFAMVLRALLLGRHGTRLSAVGAGFLLAAAVHSAYNHFLFAPLLATIGVVLLLPPLLMAVFQREEKAVEQWLNVGFDADTELLELINSGRLSESPVGIYLQRLRERFRGEVVADLLCYLRLHVELALRAKGVLLMRESGFEPGKDPELRAKFEELAYLEDSIGKTGRLAMKPFLQVSRKDLWQLYMLGR
jgi:RsiW-degrading membrane proteinase PrsW (M82 family)